MRRRLMTVFQQRAEIEFSTGPREDPVKVKATSNVLFQNCIFPALQAVMKHGFLLEAASAPVWIE